MTNPWQSIMIAADADLDGAPLFRKQFTLDAGHGAVARATLRATGLGIYEAHINGMPVGDDVLSPGWSSYEWRLRYRTHDVTSLLGFDNVLGVSLGNGWYRGRLGFLGHEALYGDELGLLAELEIVFDDGHRQVIGTDDTWRAGLSSTTSNQLYDGQTIDARRDPMGWDRPGFDDTRWVGVHPLEFDHARLVEAIAAPVVRQESVSPQRIWTAPSGRNLIDFGQNMVGWLRFTVQGPAGRVITIRHAEVLEAHELGIRPLRTAKATDTFILSGGLDTFEPTKTFHGFRYVDVDGWPGELSTDSLEAVVVHSRLTRIGHFESSSPALNQLHHNVVWSLRGNFLDLPTDCPQRDERLGWTGDIAVFAPTAAFLYDVNDFLQEWLADLAVEQGAAGYVPIVVPDLLKHEDFPDDFEGFNLSPATAIWGDAAVWVPWALWEAYGDMKVLERQFDSMASHVRSAEALLSPSGLWDQGGQFGDWLDPDAPPDKPGESKADNGVVATASLYRSACMVASAAELLGRTDDASQFLAMANRLKAAFNAHYVDVDGTVLSDCATVYALAIAFGLLDSPRRELAGARLAEVVENAQYRVTTGFAGTPYVTKALSDTGHLESAYRLLLEEECPSWLYPVSMGATTIWERWDSMLPDGTINPGEMTSFNHYALGAVADWMHQVVAGIAPAEPGYHKIRIAPRPGGGLTWVNAKLLTPRGQVAVAWDLSHGQLSVEVTIPEGCTADVDLPGSSTVTVDGGHHTFTRTFDEEPELAADSRRWGRTKSRDPAGRAFGSRGLPSPIYPATRS